jgi:ABC-2 type transport system ATP-binding protein
VLGYLTILQAENVYKSYGNFKALDGFSCNIPSGIIGLLGPNGAGKTTFIKTLLGFHSFERGEITLMDKYSLPRDFLRAKDLIGYMPEKETKMIHINAFKYVAHFGRMGGLPYNVIKQRTFDVLHYVGLEEARYRNMETFSTGMLQRVKLATALVHDPEIIILDEPTAGLDPPGREQMLSLIKDLGKNHNKNIIMCTHLLPDVEKISDFVVVISQGQLVMQGNLKKLLERTGETISLKIQVSDRTHDYFHMLEENGFKVEMENKTEIQCIVNNDIDLDYIFFFKLAKDMDINIRMLSPSRVRLEDIFLDAVHEGGIK